MAFNRLYSDWREHQELADSLRDRFKRLIIKENEFREQMARLNFTPQEIDQEVIYISEERKQPPKRS